MNKESEQLTQASAMSSVETVRLEWADRKWEWMLCSFSAVEDWARVARVRVEGEELEHSLDTCGSKDTSL